MGFKLTKDDLVDSLLDENREILEDLINVPQVGLSEYRHVVEFDASATRSVRLLMSKYRASSRVGRLSSNQFGKRYNVEKMIGRGGQAGVFLALDVIAQQRVAIKVMPIESNIHLMDIAYNEAKIQGHIDHPNVLPLLDFGMQENDFYIVTPLCKFLSLIHI